ncbi:MAG: hypothetical protein ABIZ82_06340 [Candidatus Tumulicola sp.]
MSVPRVRISPSPPASYVSGLVILIALSAMLSGAALPQSVSPQLAGLPFLLGDWRAGSGNVAETEGTSRGRSTFTLEAGGNVTLRKDHTDLFTASGQPAGSFDQIMMIYPEGNTIHADYSDGAHVIHYVRAYVVAGRSVTFVSASRADAPTFRLSYELSNPTTLAVKFELAPPGSTTFHPIATGTLTR